MTDNRYAPPKSSLQNGLPSQPPTSKPRQVTMAIWFLSVYVVLAVPQAALLPNTQTPSIVISAVVTLIGGLALLVWQVARGHGWARWVLLGFYIVSTLMGLAFLSIAAIMASVNEGPYLFAMSGMMVFQIAQIAVGGVGNYLLFRLPSRLWFKAGRSA